MTGMGSRLLKSWLLSPSRDRTEATARHRAIEALRSGAAMSAGVGPVSYTHLDVYKKQALELLAA